MKTNFLLYKHVTFIFSEIVKPVRWDLFIITKCQKEFYNSEILLWCSQKKLFWHFFLSFYFCLLPLVFLFTPFVPEAPHHILLYVVGRCTKGVVELNYEWCHVIIPLLCCNELYSWWTVTPRVSLCPLLLWHHRAWPRASSLQGEFGELV